MKNQQITIPGFVEKKFFYSLVSPMKNKKVLLAGVFSAIAIAALLFWFLNASPVAVVKNTSSFPITVRFETDIGESYSVGIIAAGASARIAITGRDKLLWAVAEFPNGLVVESQRIYTTSKGTVSTLVTSDTVEISYEL